MHTKQLLDAYQEVKATHLMYQYAGWRDEANKLAESYSLSQSQSVQKMPQNPYETI